MGLKEEKVELDGEILSEAFRRQFRIAFPNGHEAIGYTSGQMRRYRIQDGAWGQCQGGAVPLRPDEGDGSSTGSAKACRAHRRPGSRRAGRQDQRRHPPVDRVEEQRLAVADLVGDEPDQKPDQRRPLPLLQIFLGDHLDLRRQGLGSAGSPGRAVVVVDRVRRFGSSSLSTALSGHTP